MSHELLAAFVVFAVATLFTPGPNNVMLMASGLNFGLARTLPHGFGVPLGFGFMVLVIGFGLGAFFAAFPLAYEVLRYIGGAYLLYLAWQAVKPGGRSPFEIRELPGEPPLRLLAMGATTSVLNPKLAMLFISLLPQFIDYQQGHVLGQSLLLGSILISAFACANGLVAICSSSIAACLRRRPALMLAQRWAMGLVLSGLAASMVADALRLASR